MSIIIYLNSTEKWNSLHRNFFPYDEKNLKLLNSQNLEDY